MKLLEENIGSSFSALVFTVLFWRIPKHQQKQKLTSGTVSNPRASANQNKKISRQPMNGRKFLQTISEKGLISKIYKNFIQLSHKTNLVKIAEKLYSYLDVLFGKMSNWKVKRY